MDTKSEWESKGLAVFAPILDYKIANGEVDSVVIKINIYEHVAVGYDKDLYSYEYVPFDSIKLIYSVAYFDVITNNLIKNDALKYIDAHFHCHSKKNREDIIKKTKAMFRAQGSKDLRPSMQAGLAVVFRETTARNSFRLPGAMQSVIHPETGETDTVRSTVINLNDEYEWSREQIADWLDKIHDEGMVDLAFTEGDDG